MPATSLLHRDTREVLHRLATHLLARAQEHHLGRISLHAAPGGFATSRFGPRGTRLRISGELLVRETDTPSRTWTVPITGSTLRGLATFAGVDLAQAFTVGPDTPALGDLDEPVEVDGAAVATIADWYALTAQALDRVRALLPDVGAGHGPSLAQLWPEHFDLAIDAAYDTAAPGERRVNVGGTPGDGFHEDPYLYVGPWTPERPGDDYWNAPFGAVIGRSEVTATTDPLATAVGFFSTGITRLVGVDR
jgi:hypothetical protein